MPTEVTTALHVIAGKRLASQDGGTLCAFDPATGEVLAELAASAQAPGESGEA